MNLYCISGLGADERLFRNLQLQKYTLKFIKWIKPVKSDTLESYSDKLIAQIDLEQPFSLLGVSLGGIIATILSSKINPEKVFVISSIKSSIEFPTALKVINKLKISSLVNSWLIKNTKPIVGLFFGKMSKSDKQLFNKMIDESDQEFLLWAIKSILKWQSKNSNIPYQKFTHIIGDKDLIFKKSYIKNALVIKGGTHLMILNKGKEISNIVDND